MAFFENIVSGFIFIMVPMRLIALLFGFLLGLTFGIIPGLGSVTAILLVLPFSFGMEPETLFIILSASYCAALYGGSVPAILFNTPGTASAIMTTLDGYPLARQGRGSEALSMSAIGSSFGSIIGAMCLFAFTPWLANIALSFGPTEYFALAVFGMSAVTSLGRGNQLKSLIAALLGVLVATVGVDNFQGLDRFTFGTKYLLSGFVIVPVLIGTFAVSEILKRSTSSAAFSQTQVKVTSFRLPRLGTVVRQLPNMVRSSLIGLLIGVLPGEGGAIACTISYNEARRWSKHGERFGKGAIEGVVAAETANNTVGGTALIPTLALGVPGSPTAAALIGAFLIVGLNPGPQLIISRPTMVHAIFATIFVSGILILLFGIGPIRFIAKIIEVPYSMIAPLILLFALWGTVSIRKNLWDAVVVMFFGVVGYFFRKYQFSLIAFTLGFILCNLSH